MTRMDATTDHAATKIAEPAVSAGVVGDHEVAPARRYHRDFTDLIFHLLVLGGVPEERAGIGAPFAADLIVKRLQEDGRV